MKQGLEGSRPLGFQHQDTLHDGKLFVTASDEKMMREASATYLKHSWSALSKYVAYFNRVLKCLRCSPLL